ncbi:MAG: response regulator [Acetobacteraceae bacterium]
MNMVSFDDSGQVPTLSDSDETMSSRNHRLLVVDDQKGMTRVICAAAASLGFVTREVNDPHRATQAFLEFRPDLLVLDLIMPEKDGIDVLNEVLLIDPGVRLILISGYGETYLRLGEAVSKFHRPDAIEVLRKPFRIDALRDALRRMIKV